MNDIPLTVHQLWLGEDLPKEEKKYLETAFKVCAKAGYTYKLWTLADIIGAFGKDTLGAFWEKIWSTIPYPPIFAAAVDYFKWKVLATTPENERAFYIDADVEMMKQGRKAYKLPTSQAYVAFGMGDSYNVPSTACIQVFGPEVAKLAVEEAEKRLSQFDIDSHTLFEDFFRQCAKRTGELALGKEWVQTALLPRLETADLSAEVLPVDVFCQFGQHESPLLLHHEKHYAFGRHTDSNAVEPYLNGILLKVRAATEKYNQNRKRVVIFMDSARRYTDFYRTLDLITAKDIRDIQRRTTFAYAFKLAQLDYYFILGKSDIELDPAEKESPEFFYAASPEDTDTESHLSERYYDAIKWVIRSEGFDFLYFCRDNNFIQLFRLLTYCSTRKPGELVTVVNPDQEGNYTRAGVLMSVATARKIVKEGCDAPKSNEEFGSWLKHCMEVIGGRMVQDEKFANNKGQYPCPTNGRITTFDVNPYDLVLLAGLNAEKKE